ncbi:MAG: hypothetical protein ACYTBV_11045 [Planctomycetota bacterium]|jgi:hypothetical protein
MGTNSNLSLINNPLAFTPLHQSRKLYKSALFLQNKPNLPKHQNNHNACYRKGLREFFTFRTPKKQTQSNPIPNLLFAAVSESGEGNYWHFKAIMVQILTLNGLNYSLNKATQKGSANG